MTLSPTTVPPQKKNEYNFTRATLAPTLGAEPLTQEQYISQFWFRAKCISIPYMVFLYGNREEDF